MEAVEHALQLLLDGALREPQGIQARMVAAIPSDEFVAALWALGEVPIIGVDCGQAGCGKRLGKLRLQPGWGLATREHTPRNPEERGNGPMPWTQPDALKRSGVRGPSGSDGQGIFTFVCGRCGAEHPMAPHKRTRWFLEALRDRERALLVYDTRE